MARFPGAIWKPITASKGRKKLTVYNRMNLHVAVSEGASLHAFFNKSGQVDSHFYVRRDGTVEQYVDTAYRAFADLEGNDATISVETQGMGGGGWDPKQRESLAQLFAWAAKTHGIARKMATNSKPGASSQGLSWHRLGCDGNFPALPSILAGRRQLGGGMHYSKSLGKVCPGDGRVVQIPDIFKRAEAILGGASSKPTTPQRQEPDMDATQAKQLSANHNILNRKLSDGAGATTPDQIWERTLDVSRRTLAATEARSAALEALAKSVGVDPAKIEAIVQTAVNKALDAEYVLTPKEK